MVVQKTLGRDFMEQDLAYTAEYAKAIFECNAEIQQSLSPFEH